MIRNILALLLLAAPVKATTNGIKFVGGGSGTGTDSTKVPLTGGTMTGQLTINVGPVTSTGALTAVAEFGPDSSTTTIESPYAPLVPWELHSQCLTSSVNGSNLYKNGLGCVWGQDAVTNGVTGQEGNFTASVSSGLTVANSTTVVNQCQTFSMRGRVNSAVTSHRAIYGQCANSNWSATDQSTYLAWNVTPSGTITPLATNAMVLTNQGELDLRSNSPTIQTWGAQAGGKTETIGWDASGNTIWKNTGSQSRYWQNSSGGWSFWLSPSSAAVFAGSVTVQGAFMAQSGTVNGSVPGDAVWESSGSLVIDSTVTVASQRVLDVRNQAGTSLFQVQQGGNINLSSDFNILPSSITIGNNVTHSTINVAAAVQSNFGNCQNASAYYTAAFGQSGCSATPNAANGNTGDRSLIPVRFYNTTTVSLVGLDSGDATEVGIGAESGGAWLGSAKGNVVQFRSNGAERARIGIANEFSVGVLAAGNATMEIKSTSTTAGYPILNVENSSRGQTFGVDTSSGISLASGTVVYSNLGPLTFSTASSVANTLAKGNIYLNTQGQTVFTPNLVSTFTSAALSGSTTATTLGGCLNLSTSTFNIVQGNGSVLLGFNGAMSVSGLGSRVMVGVVVDGLLVNGETSTKGLTSYTEQVSTDNNNVGFLTIVSGLAGGAHTACLTFAATANTATIDSTDSVAKLWGHTLP